MTGMVAVGPGFAEIVDLEAPVEKVAGGLQFTEGPVWDRRGRSLTFSDIPADTLYRWTEAGGTQVLRKPSGQSNGNTLDREGRLVTCEHRGRRVSRTSRDGSVETLVDSYQGKRLNSPNDAVCAANGDIYFTDPPYGLRQPDGSFAASEYGLNGVFRWSAATGELTLLVEDFVRPNGLVLSNDGRLLYIADTQLAHVRAFDVSPDGMLANGRLFVETKHDGVTARPDGMKGDERGNLYVTSSTATGVWVYDRQGRLLGQIGVGENPANCGFGDGDWRTLFITAQTSVYSVRLKVAGQPVGP